MLVERIRSTDVQELMRKITIVPDREFSLKFPKTMPCSITIGTRDGRTLTKEIEDYEGFLTHPMDWRMVTRKFERLTSGILGLGMQKELEDKVHTLDNRRVSELANILQQEMRVVAPSPLGRS